MSEDVLGHAADVLGSRVASSNLASPTATLPSIRPCRSRTYPASRLSIDDTRVGAFDQFGPPGRERRPGVQHCLDIWVQISGCHGRSWWPATRCRMCSSTPASAIPVKAVCPRPSRARPGCPEFSDQRVPTSRVPQCGGGDHAPREPSTSHSSARRPAVSRTSVGRSGSMIGTVLRRRQGFGSGTGEVRTYSRQAPNARDILSGVAAGSTDSGNWGGDVS